MPAVILESAFGSQYDDTPSSYQFPGRYLNVFSPLTDGTPMIAILYEPRGDDGRGRMSYVGVATISHPPTATGARSKNGEQLWRVEYDGPAIPLVQPVSREVAGLPVESWLKPIPRGRERNVATFGRAVRSLNDSDLEQILLLGNAPELGSNAYPVRSEHADPITVTRERTESMVRSIQRDARFRETVVRAYDGSCAVSGFNLGSTAVTRSIGILDAAHIRPVGQSGPDHVTNGIPLTPTLHRLFDSGLFTVAYEEGRPVIRTSPHLEERMLQVPERGFELRLVDGLRLITPTDPLQWPNREQLQYHQHQVYRA